MIINFRNFEVDNERACSICYQYKVNSSTEQVIVAPGFCISSWGFAKITSCEFRIIVKEYINGEFYCYLIFRPEKDQFDSSLLDTVLNLSEDCIDYSIIIDFFKVRPEHISSSIEFLLQAIGQICYSEKFVDWLNTPIANNLTRVDVINKWVGGDSCEL